MAPPQENMSSGDNTSANSTNSRSTSNSNTQSGMNFLVAHKFDVVLWILRWITVVSGLLFLFPVYGKQALWYQKLLVGNAASSALRLHMRTPNFQFNRVYLASLLSEDSCHYLIFSLIFLYFNQITLVVVPVIFYALLHALTFTNQMLDAFHIALTPVRNLISKVTSQQVTLLRLIACTEIFLMPAIVASVFAGRGNMFVPFMYYRFITFRYASRRNPYCRILFSEMRMALTQLAGHHRCPAIGRTIIRKGIDFVSRLAPPLIPSPN